jgi:hypothetical protein
MKTFTFVVTLAVSISMLLLPSPASAQGQDPLIGTWNLSGGSGSSAFIAVMTFNAGGTTVEFDTSGTNSSASPGESISLGKWSNTGNSTYTFKEQNYIYDASGNLSLIAITNCTLILASNQKSFKDNCNVSFFTCSVASCPGTLVSSSSGPATGKRF